MRRQTKRHGDVHRHDGRPDRACRPGWKRRAASAQTTGQDAAQMVTDRKLLNRRMAESAGKITSAEISSDPTRFMASTMITATTTAISRL